MSATMSNHVTRQNRKEKQETGSWCVEWIEEVGTIFQGKPYPGTPLKAKYWTEKGARDKAHDLAQRSTNQNIRVRAL